MTPPTPALELSEITKRYGGLTAVNGVSLSIAPGERRAIIGPNGAGKTTLFKLISGEVRLTHGSIRLFGREISHVSAPQRVKLGLGRTYQITNVFPGLSVEQNVFLALQGQISRKFDVFGPQSTARMRTRTREVLDQLHLGNDAPRPVREIGYGQQRQLELALALVGDPKVLLLDEPAAGLSSVERGVMSSLVSSLPRDLTVVLIEHDMDVALKLVDTVSVLNNGELLAEGSPADIQKNETVQAIYLGALDTPSTAESHT
jgi:branched-chain amino acid transport system ATP-binding protein